MNRKEMPVSFVNSFKIQLTLVLIFIVGISFFLFEEWIRVGPLDVSAYHALEASSQPLEKSLEVKSSRQHRKKVRKTWMTNKGRERHQLRMVSDQSDLIFSQQDHKKEIIEHMYPVICDIQEELYFIGIELPQAVQRIRHFEAEKAIFFYCVNRIEAQKVTLARYTAEGHALYPTVIPVQMLMQGEAKAAQFSLMDSHEIAVSAENIKATLYSQGVYQ